MEDYIAYNINRRVQDNVKAFGVEGFFIFALMGILLFSFILLVILNTCNYRHDNFYRFIRVFRNNRDLPIPTMGNPGNDQKTWFI